MAKCCYCDNEDDEYGICEDCLEVIHKYQEAIVGGGEPEVPFYDHIVGMVEVTCNKLDYYHKVIETWSVKLPVYDFMHMEANDDYSPDSEDSELREEKLSFTWKDSKDSSLEEIISEVYRGDNDYTKFNGDEYSFTDFKYSFKVLGSRKSKGKSEDEVRAKRLLDLYSRKT